MESPPVLTREQVRRVDAIAVERYGMSGLVLMENAGRGVVDVLLEIDPAPGPVAILCGKGNNAGDGFVMARHLQLRGVAAKVVLLFPPAELAGDARVNYEILVRSELPIIDLSASVTADSLHRHAGGAAWLVDAMLGTGATGEPREPLATAIHWMNGHPGRRLAVDLPSGLDCDTGAAASATICADVTCTFVALKAGYLQPQARPHLGDVHVVSIGVPERVVQEAVGI
ncbi:MAG TPA: NAD(P)H-hydrate epimerase [Lacipirellula sp.]